MSDCLPCGKYHTPEEIIGNIAACDGSNVAFRVTGVSTAPPYDALTDPELLRNFKEIIEKSDGYYLKDYSPAALDAKLVDSMCCNFAGANQYIGLVHYSGSDYYFDELLAVPDNSVVILEWWGKFNDLTVDSGVPADTSSNSSYLNIIAMNGLYASTKGWMLTLDNNQIQICISSSNSATQRSVHNFTVNVVLDNLAHKFKLTIDATTTNAKTVSLQIDAGTAETQNVKTTVGSIYQYAGFGRIGAYTTSAAMSLSRFMVTRNGTKVLDLALTSNYSKVWDMVSGYERTVRGCTWSAANDKHPVNCLVGYEYFNGSTYQNMWTYVPYKNDGTKITPTLSGRIKYGEVPASGYYNYSETKIQPNPTNNAALTAAGFADTVKWNWYDIMGLVSNKVFLHGRHNGSDIPDGIAQLLIYSADKTAVQKTAIHSTLGNTIIPTMLLFGDSIAVGAGTADTYDSDPLPTAMTNPITTAKIFDIVGASNYTYSPPFKTSVLRTLSLTYCIQPTTGANTSGHGMETPYAYNFAQPLYILKYGVGGSIAGLDDTSPYADWSPLQTAANGNMPKLLLAIPKCIEEIRKAGHEPHWFIVTDLGSNDAEYSTAMRDAFGTNYTACIAAVRAVIGSDNVIHHFRVRRNTPDRIIVGNITDSLVNTITGLYIYDCDTIDLMDSIHPSTTGQIQRANKILNADYILP